MLHYFSGLPISNHTRVILTLLCLLTHLLLVTLIRVPFIYFAQSFQQTLLEFMLLLSLMEKWKIYSGDIKSLGSLSEEIRKRVLPSEALNVLLEKYEHRF